MTDLMHDVETFEAPAEDDFDAAIDALEQDEAPAPAAAPEKPKAKAKPKAGKRDAVDADAARAVIERYEHIGDMDAADVETVAELLEVDADTVEVTVAIASQRKAPGGGVEGIAALLSLMELRQDNPKKAMMAVMGYTRPERKPIWRVLGILDWAERKAIDPHEMNASLHIDDAIEAHMGELERVRDLAELLTAGQ